MNHCDDCTRPIIGADGVPNPNGPGLLHKACEERLRDTEPPHDDSTGDLLGDIQ